jgi:hypothetical protein
MAHDTKAHAASESAQLPIDLGLTEPFVEPQEYLLDECEAGTVLTVLIRFGGDTKPAAGDRVTPVLELVGVAEANLNATTRRTLVPYVVRDADLLDGGRYVPIRFFDEAGPLAGFTAEQFANIGESRGELYFVLERGEGGRVVRSPSNNVLVDTMPPGSTAT